MSSWGYALMSVSMLLFWAALLVGGLALFRLPTSASASGSHLGPLPPEEVLAERYARGDIDDEEYHQRREVLRTRHPIPTGRP